jgi:lipopolysaccharide export system protein LptC
VTSERENEEATEKRPGFPDLVAPRRLFKRKKRSSLLLVLKIGLPLIAVICVAYIVIWSRWQLPNITINPVKATEDAAKPTSDVTINKVKYDGVDAKNRPFSITAEAATQPDNTVPADPNATVPAGTPQNTRPTQPAAPKPDSLINLKQILADMTMADGAWVAIQADSGVYDRDASIVDLKGNVTLFHDSGLQFQTDAAKVDLNNDTAQGDQPVEGQNPNGTLAAEGFQVLNDGRTVLFLGRSYMKIYPKSHGNSGTTPGTTTGTAGGSQ